MKFILLSAVCHVPTYTYCAAYRVCQLRIRILCGLFNNTKPKCFRRFYFSPSQLLYYTTWNNNILSERSIRWVINDPVPWIRSKENENAHSCYIVVCDIYIYIYVYILYKAYEFQHLINDPNEYASEVRWPTVVVFPSNGEVRFRISGTVRRIRWFDI